MERKLKSLYSDPKSAASFSSPENLYHEYHKTNKNVKRSDIARFLETQKTYTLHRPRKKNFLRNKTCSPGIDVDWQADLADMKSIKRQNSGFTFLLVVVDVLSRFAFVEPVKKKTANEVAHAFEKIINKSNRKCWILTTDRGREFLGSSFQDMLKRHDIKHHYATSPDVKCAIAERYIRTLKTRIWRYFTDKATLKYITVLPHFVDSINHTKNQTIGYAPADVNKNNQTEIWNKVCGSTPKKKVILFKAGHQVRIAKEKHQLIKGYLPNFTFELFIVKKLLQNRYPATYKLIDLNGEEIEGIFYNEELVRAAIPSKLVDKIDYIVKSRIYNKKLQHFVKWKLKHKPPSWIYNTALIL